MGILSKLFGPSRRVMPEPVRDLRTFKEVVVESKTPVIVDVWSEVCAPCKRMVPVLIDIATRYEGRVKVVEIAADSEPALLARLKVRGTPTLIVFHRGRELGRQVGFRPAEWFDQMIAAEFPSAAEPA